jgi:hypothetical protein
MNHDHYVLPCLEAPRAESIRGARLGENVAREAAKRVRALADLTRLMLAAALRETQASSVYATSPGSPNAPRTSSLTTCASCPPTPTLLPDGTAKWSCIR